MVPRRLCIIQGHPDPTGGHFGHALAKAYGEAAEQAGHQVETVTVARLDLDFLKSKSEWESPSRAPQVLDAQRAIAAADHLMIVYPLWMGTMPAVLKAFFEQVLRPGFAVEAIEDPATVPRRLLQGKSARVVVTMGMPGLIYHYFYGAHSLKSLERNILGFVGIKPIRHSLVGMVDSPGNRHEKWLRKMARLGARLG